MRNYTPALFFFYNKELTVGALIPEIVPVKPVIEYNFAVIKTVIIKPLARCEFNFVNYTVTVICKAPIGVR